ncbi:ANTAR domain-containing protein [Promicromonospora sp. NPDC023805]|uniref:ANTAR domain-containing protein n=1 Tax=Promicromonospora sp. NPDC023805 TaxID=3154696 RepID=UPI00340670D3
MRLTNETRTAFADDAAGGLDFDSSSPSRLDDVVSPALVGEAMIERAKSFVVVAKRVDDDEAAQILLDAAEQANVPMRVAADQVMTALERDDVRDGITPDMLVHALDSVRPVEGWPVEGPPVEAAPAEPERSSDPAPTELIEPTEPTGPGHPAPQAA